VLSNLQGFAAKGWMINEDIINVMAVSIAIGTRLERPAAVSSRRSRTRCRRDVQFGLISVCAQGGMGFAVVLERP